MKTVLHLLAIAALALLLTMGMSAQNRGQVGDVDWLVTPIQGMCLGETGFAWPCPPKPEDAGVLVHLRSGDPTFDGYRVTVRYTTDRGAALSLTQDFQRMKEFPWTAHGFTLGAGARITSIEIEKRRATDIPVKIEIGPTEFGPPA